MSDHLCSRLPHAARNWFTGTVLRPHVDAYAAWLRSRGYAPGTVACYLRSVAHFAHWVAHRARALDGIDEPLVRRFVDGHLPSCRCARRCVRAKNTVRAALVQLLAFLRCEGRIPARASCTPAAIGFELDLFDRHLATVRGLQDTTRHGQLKHVRDFLLAQFADGAVDVTTMTPCDVERFTRQYTAGCKPASVKQVCIALRSYLRFKATQGIDTARLSGALPQVAQWRLSGLPNDLSAQEVERLLGAFDRRTATGRRDYAIARCYIDLGLRTAEVVRLRLEDLDWRAGRVQIRSKGRRTDVLPLPMATGRAIAAYLRAGRPLTASRALFLRHRPPCDKPATTDTIRGAIRNAALRCGLAERLTGTHILRHTVARRLVQGGASLKAIADVLRHRSLDTTTIYAKVDLDALASVAAPWPGSQP